MPTTSTSKTRSGTSRNKLVPGDLADQRRAPTHPGVMFKLEFREPQDPPVSQREAARRLGISYNYMNLIELGERPVSPEMCVKFEALTGASAEMWAGLQMRYDLWHAFQSAKKPRPIPGDPFASSTAPSKTRRPRR
ncbi:MAG: HigA family addiction module antitoxin [Acidobacteriota bacterium]|nr:HigA family addiction module antitoxin [Acidobacteriota bacterium]